jgi:hypothetical protein
VIRIDDEGIQSGFFNHRSIQMDTDMEPNQDKPGVLVGVEARGRKQKIRGSAGLQHW